MLHREARRLGELLTGRVAAELCLELPRSTRELHAPLVHVRRDADRRRLSGDRALAGLPDPPSGVGRELEPTPPVELLDGTVQPDHAFLDQVEQRQVAPLVALRDRDHESKVRIDHPLLRGQVSALDPLCERNLLGGGQQRIPAGPVHEQAQRIGRHDRGSVVVEQRWRDDLDVAGVELRPQRGQLVVVELVLEHERIEHGLVDRTARLGFVQKFKRIDAQLLLTSFE